MGVPWNGETYGPWQYIVRFTRSPNPFYTHLAKLRGFNFVFWLRIVDKQVVTYTGGFEPTPPTRHFPWGYRVDPDVDEPG